MDPTQTPLSLSFLLPRIGNASPNLVHFVKHPYRQRCWHWFATLYHFGKVGLPKPHRTPLVWKRKVGDYVIIDNTGSKSLNKVNEKWW
ncbi:hypothetical protein HanIR_Chr17g0891021 [Helianthus annuus]|nr:hypothetical protein HanIR_Chr17g0891021 [Helianthus annuus]